MQQVGSTATVMSSSRLGFPWDLDHPFKNLGAPFKSSSAFTSGGFFISREDFKRIEVKSVVGEGMLSLPASIAAGTGLGVGGGV